MWNKDARPAFVKPETCRSCDLWEVTHLKRDHEVTYTGEGFTKPEGYPALGVAFCAEASGEHEELEGLPLRPYAQAGSIHTRVLRSLGVSRKQVLAFNVLSCRPPNNRLVGEWYEMSAIAKCAQHRNPIIQSFRDSCASNSLVREPVIVALGGVAFRALTGLDGEKLSISYTRGYPIRTPYGLVVGTFHPAEVRRKLKHLGVLTEDYAKAFMYAKDGFREFPRNYTPWPTETDKRDFRDRVRGLASRNEPVWLNFDFETDDILPNMPRGTWPGLQSIQLSLGPGTGIFLDANTDNWPLICELMGSSLRKATHNGWDFDVPLAAFHKIPVGGVVDDTLWMFHHYQPDLVMEDAGAEAETDFRFSTAASLQFVASFFGMDFIWKNLRTSLDVNEQRFYGIADVDATARITAPGTGLPDRMREKGVWAGYERYVREFYPILKRMAERGVPIDRKSQFEFAGELGAIEIQLDKKIQLIHPDELKFCAPPHGYVNGPKEGPKIRKRYLDGEAIDMPKV